MEVQPILSELRETGYFQTQGVCQDDLLDVAKELGEIRVDPRSPEPIRTIRPQPIAEAKPNTLSSRYGLGSFPFHTDVAHWSEPARFVILYCESPGRGKRPTHLQDFRTWDLGLEGKRALLRDVWKTGHFRPQLCTIGKINGIDLALRFDEGCMKPMTASAWKLRKFLLIQIHASPIIDVKWTVGKMLIIDNHRVLHSRGRAYFPDPDRAIKRVLVGG